MNREFEAQLAACNHKPFLHNLLADRFECLCGRTSLPIGATCPVPQCLCKRPKS